MHDGARVNVDELLDHVSDPPLVLASLVEGFNLVVPRSPPLCRFSSWEICPSLADVVFLLSFLSAFLDMKRLLELSAIFCTHSVRTKKDRISYVPNYPQLGSVRRLVFKGRSPHMMS